MLGSFWLFMCLGLAGSAGPAHFGFRILAFRHHRDRKYAFAAGSEDGEWGYSWWLMRWGHAGLRDASMNFFGGSAAVMGWLALVGIIGAGTAMALQR